MGVTCRKVAIPAAIMALCMRRRISVSVSAGFAAAAMMLIGTILVTNIARICCIEKGRISPSPGFPSKVYSVSLFGELCFSL